MPSTGDVKTILMMSCQLEKREMRSCLHEKEKLTGKSLCSENKLSQRTGSLLLIKEDSSSKWLREKYFL